MSINNTQFSILMTSVTLINTVLALVAGVYADDFSSNAFGTIRITLAINIVIFIGSLITTVGAQHLNFNLMLAGQFIFGLGDCAIVTFQETILSRWFRDQQLTIVWGLMLSMARLTKFIAKLICYPLVDATGDFTRPIILSTILCAISIAANVLYWITMTRVGLATVAGKEIYSSSSRTVSNLTLNHPGSSRWKSLSLFFYLPAIYWMVPWLQLTLSSVLSAFDDVSTEFVQFEFTTSSLDAGFTSSFVQLVPIIVAPLSGLIIDRFGRRLYFLMLGGILLLVGLLLLSYSQANPIAGILLISSTFALGSIGIMSSCTLILPVELIGIGVGLKKSANNVGSTIISIIVGYIQDLTFHDGDNLDNFSDQVNQYDYVMVFFIAVSSFAIVLIAVFWYMDRVQLGGWLQANKKERERRLEEVKQISIYGNGDDHVKKEALKIVGYQIKQKKSYMYVGLYAIWFVVSWVIFFVFALMPIYQDYQI